MVGREPFELLKLISRLDNLRSDDYKNKVADKYPKFFEGPGVMKDRCQTFPGVSPKKRTLLLVSETKD